MRLSLLLLLQVLLFLPFTSFAANSSSNPLVENDNKKDLTEARKAEVINAYGKLPLYFIENKGQADSAVKFYERGASHATFFTEQGVVIAFTKSKAAEDEKAAAGAVTLSFVGASEKAVIVAADKMPGHVNYFTGNDRTKWRSNIPTYGALIYENLYKNIDVKFYGNNRELEYDVIVRPGADPRKVTFAYKGVEGLSINRAGELEIILGDGKLIQKKPFIYQDIKGERVAVDGSYRLFKGKDGAFSYGFNVASYDKTKNLVIDPVLVYSTYLGGSNIDSAFGITVDSTGAAYVTGETLSLDFPVFPLPLAPGGIQAVVASLDAFITKIDPAGAAYVYSTFLGGSGSDTGISIAVDNTGAAYITGMTDSLDFPLFNPLQNVPGGGVDAFITKLDSTGAAFVYSTYLGGGTDDNGLGIAVDGAGAAYVAGVTASINFPLANSMQPAFGGGITDAFVTKIDSVGTAFVYSTYLGGSGDDIGEGIALSQLGEAYVTGSTASANFPILAPIQGTFGGLLDAFVTKLNPAGTALLYSTYLGGTGSDSGNAIAVDSTGAAFVTGDTNFSDFPVVAPIQAVFGGLQDAFVTKINPTGTALVYSTYLGGSDIDFGRGIALDGNGKGSAHVSGFTLSTDFPLESPVQATLGSAGFLDAFVTKINPAGSLLTYSSYLGGSFSEDGFAIAVDPLGAAYVAGATASSDFPVLNPIQGLTGGSIDGFVSKISGPVVVLTLVPDATTVARGGILGYNVTATNATATQQCFNYWENLNLPDGSTFPVTGELFGPVRLCLNAGASKTVHLTHGVPNSANLGTYVLNSFLGAYNFPTIQLVVDEIHTNIDVTAFPPPPVVAPKKSYKSWRLIQNGFRQ